MLTIEKQEVGLTSETTSKQEKTHKTTLSRLWTPGGARQ